ncbi:hypothetical protein I3843_10G035400 [Carya illinoinensis]|nr:hypothetical protein I3843_10G035400 [Carya illinoinensis]
MSSSKNQEGLRFRNIDNFNRAMLAKQLWRMITNTNSLAAKVMKEKYFRKTSVLKANLGYGPSYIWRSLWGVRDLIRAGIRHRVGNGKKIKIWEDKWLPTPSSFEVQSPVSNLGKEATVDALIEVDSGNWNQQMVEENFKEEEVKAILAIPTSRMGLEDKIY